MSVATQVQSRLLARIEAVERTVAAHLEQHEALKREWEELERSMLEEVGAESLEQFEERTRASGTPILDRLMDEMSYEEWERIQGED